MTADAKSRAARANVTVPEHVGDAAEVNYARDPGPDFGPLARDRIPVRAMTRSDLAALVAIDRAVVGEDRSVYLGREIDEALEGADVRVSLVAEIDGAPAGFVIARVDLGDYGRVEPTAVLDTIGVDPEFRNRGIGRALLSQLLINLAALRVERLRTELVWNDHDLLGFFDRCGFRPSQMLCVRRAAA
jgi:ribosomal protein S18 acetylase RimI-like enzyme